MSTTYNGADANNGLSITRPSDGDRRKVASVNPAFEALCDSIVFLTNRSPALLAAGGEIGISLRECHDGGGVGDWDWDPTDGTWHQTNIALAPVLERGVPPIFTGELDEVHVRLQGAPGHGVPLPDTMPTVTVYGSEDGSRSSLGDTTDSSADAAAYELSHWVSVTNLAHDFDEDAHIWIAINGETDAGGDDVIGLELQAIKMLVKAT